MTDPVDKPSGAVGIEGSTLPPAPGVPAVKDRLVQPSGTSTGISSHAAPALENRTSDDNGEITATRPPVNQDSTLSTPTISQLNPPKFAGIPAPTRPQLTNGNGSPHPPSSNINQTSMTPALTSHTTPQSGEKRFTSEEKGKGRAPLPSITGNGNANGNANGTSSSPTLSDVAEGRGKREKKKRRLSATGEIDPNSIHDDQHKRKKKEDPPPRPRSSTPAPPLLPLSAEDKAYFARIEANKNKPPLSEMTGPCPVWSNTRKGLQSAVEYLRDPTRTGGASVDIGPGGKARGVILEEQAPTDLNLWTMDHSRTLLLPIGRPRARRRKDTTETKEAADTDHDMDGPSGGSPTAKSPPKRDPEGAEIEALLMTHRARIPIALAVAQDYSGVPFKVPRPFVALGWFWIVDAWLEPVVTVRADSLSSAGSLPEIDTDRVVWRFRFEFCGGDQEGSPWWQSATRVLSERQCPYQGFSSNEKTWSVTSPDMSPTDTLRLPTPVSSEGAPQPLSQQSGNLHHCSSCDHRSVIVYSGMRRCLNEACDRWASDIELFQTPAVWRWTFAPTPASDVLRITPGSLKLTLRPAEPTDIDTRALSQTEHAGREYWIGWVCHKCGSANERKKWHGWNCEACKRTLVPRHVVYSDESLRAPLRPVSTGPRPDDGLASWPFDASFAWTLFDDDVKVVRHGLDNGFGPGTAIYHSLNHEGAKLSQRRINAKSLFRDLQRRAELSSMTREMPYKRHLANPQAPRSAEQHLSDFYTVLLGPEPVPDIESLPVGRPIPWREADETFLNLADYINERAGQIFPGEAERFNSLLVAVNPPGLSATHAPRIFVPAHAFMSFTFFGSDGVLKIRRPAGTTEKKTKQGQMTLQHGDVVGVQTGATGLEVSAHQDSFGFLCIGRQIYQTDTDPIARNTTPAVTAKVGTQSRKPLNKPPPRPAKLPHVPLTYWYVGPFPLDPERPLKVHPPMRDREMHSIPVNEEGIDASERTYTGIEVQTEVQEPPKRLDPPVRPGEGTGKKRKPTGGSEGTTTGSEKSKGRRKSVPAKVDKAGAEGRAGSSPVKKKARKSLGAQHS